MKRPNYSNLSVKEQKALWKLQSWDEIVITEADKGDAVIIRDTEDYIKEAERQLHNTENYKRLNHNPTTNKNDTVNAIIKRFHKENLLSKNIAKRLKAVSAKSSHVYLKHESNIFEYQISETSITFLDTEVYMKNNKLYTKICRKKQTFSTSTRVCSKTRLWIPLAKTWKNHESRLQQNIYW